MLNFQDDENNKHYIPFTAITEITITGDKLTVETQDTVRDYFTPDIITLEKQLRQYIKRGLE